MISRLSASAALFAVFATASLAYAADAQQQHARPGTTAATRAVARPAEVITLPGVVVTGRRSASH